MQRGDLCNSLEMWVSLENYFWIYTKSNFLTVLKECLFSSLLFCLKHLLEKWRQPWEEANRRYFWSASATCFFISLSWQNIYGHAKCCLDLRISLKFSFTDCRVSVFYSCKWLGIDIVNEATIKTVTCSLWFRLLSILGPVSLFLQFLFPFGPTK